MSTNVSANASCNVSTMQNYNIGILCFSLLGTILSLATVLIIAFSRKLRKRASNKLLINLFLADFGVCVLMIVSHVLMLDTSQNERVRGMKDAKVFHITISSLMFLSIVNRITVTLDRAIAVKKPFYYQEKFNSKMIARITLLQHGIAFIFVIILVVADQHMTADNFSDLMQLMFISVIIAGFVALTVSNAIVFVEAKKQIAMICQITYSDNKQKKKTCVRSKECKIVRIHVGMVAVFVLCWTPFLIAICQEHYGMKYEDAITVALYLVSLNYILDPIIYVFLSKDVKNQIKVTFCHALYKRKTMSMLSTTTTTTTTTTTSTINNASS